MSATSRALSIPELVEGIYLFLSTFEIQVASEVSLTFRSVIENSRALKARVDYLKLTQPEGGQSNTAYPNNDQFRWHCKHFFAETYFHGPLFILYIPTEGVENFLASDTTLGRSKYLKVMAGGAGIKSKCRAKIIDNVYGRNIRIWYAYELMAIETIATSPSKVSDYLFSVYPTLTKEDRFWLGAEDAKVELTALDFVDSFDCVVDIAVGVGVAWLLSRS